VAQAVILEPDRVLAEGDPIALSLREKYREVRMPNLTLARDEVVAIVEYLDDRSRAARSAGAPAASTAGAPAGASTGVDLTAIVVPYLRIHRELQADDLEGVADNARLIRSAAATLGPRADALKAATTLVEVSETIEAARAGFGEISDALIAFIGEQGAAVPGDLRIAYCPMAQKRWLQEGETVRNPFYGAAMPECGRIIGPASRERAP
jgi:Cu(I)/Ag(I) efflux system membrane fusion protein